jgi:hypothetical protein
LPRPLQSTTVVTEVRDGDTLNPDPGQRFFIRDEMLDGNPSRPGAPLSIRDCLLKPLPAESKHCGISRPAWPAIMANRPPSSSKREAISFPTNLSANAHGNGYADPNFIIPATIESVETDGGALG